MHASLSCNGAQAGSFSSALRTEALPPDSHALPAGCAGLKLDGEAGARFLTSAPAGTFIFSSWPLRMTSHSSTR